MKHRHMLESSGASQGWVTRAAASLWTCHFYEASGMIFFVVVIGSFSSLDKENPCENS